MRSDIEIQKLFLYDPAAASTFTDIYVGTASAPERQSQRLIVIIDYQRTRTAHRGLLESVLRNCVRSFEASRHTTPELILEAVLESLNIALPQLAPARDSSWLESLNLLVAISDHGQVHFSNLGGVQALLVHPASISIVSEASGEINPLKLFSHITSGLLEPGASMLLTTTPLLDYIAEDKIRRLLSELPPNLAERELTRLVGQVPASVTFAAVIVKTATDHDSLAARGGHQQAAPPRRGDFLATQAPSVSAERPSRLRPRVRRGFVPWLLQAVKTALTYAWAYILLLGLLTKQAASVLSRLVAAFFSAPVRHREEQAIIEGTSRRFNELRSLLRGLSRSRRTVVYAIILILFILLNLIIIRGQTRMSETVRTSYNEALLSVAEKNQAVESALIYGNDAQAEQLLMEIGTILKSIQPETREQQGEIAQYLEDNERSLLKARHINDIPSPLVGAEFSLSDGNRPSSFSASSDGTYIVAAGNELYRLEESKLTRIMTAPGPIQSLLTSGSGLLAVTADGSLVRLRNNELQPVDLSKPAAQQTITAAAVYANNLYVLDASAGAIFKYEGSSTGVFKAGTVWFQDPALLSSGRDLTVDGNIYVTTDAGSILKFSGGRREDFSNQSLRPALGPATQITTSQESNYLYLLDPQNRRIVILDKQGSIKDQFTSKQFSALSDLAITPGEASLAVLNNTTIYLLAINK